MVSRGDARHFVRSRRQLSGPGLGRTPLRTLPRLGFDPAAGLLMDVPDATVRRLAAELTAQAGLKPPRSVTRLTGGKNNRVFRIDDAGVLKLYHWDPRDPRDRLRAEWRFLSYAR